MKNYYYLNRVVVVKGLVISTHFDYVDGEIKNLGFLSLGDERIKNYVQFKIDYTPGVRRELLKMAKQGFPSSPPERPVDPLWI